ncbi:MAG: imidazoleglycerol-phosphate dehydratase, partial [Candidatus Limnocylindrales bacterium]
MTASTGARTATRARTTSETDILITVDLDGTGVTEVQTGVGFYDHLLTSFGHHALIDLRIQATGDLHIDT